MAKYTLKDYFTSHIEPEISIEQKASIYKNFLDLKAEQHYKKTHWLYKRLSYGLSTFVVAWMLFFGNFFGIFDTTPQEGTKSVEAQQIGRITNHTGPYTIYDLQNRAVAGDIITLNDYVNVAPWASIEVLVSDDFSAQVSGPAQFRIIIKDDKTWYKLAFINGWDDITVNKTKESDKNISVQTSDGVFISNSDTKSSSFSVSKDHTTQKRTITNKSNTILEIKSKEDGETIVIPAHYHTEIAKNEIDGDIIILSQAEIDEILADTTTTSSWSESPIITSDMLVHTIDITDRKNLRLILDKAFLNSEYDDLILSYALWDSDYFDNTLHNINQRLDRIAPIANIPKESHTTLDWLVEYTKHLISSLEYYQLEKELYYNLEIMIHKLKNLSTHRYGLLESTAIYKAINADYVRAVLPLSDKIYL